MGGQPFGFRRPSWFLNLPITNQHLKFSLNLKKRFIGTEPFCQTTGRQYEIMKKTLPKNGVSVIEIERLKNEEGPISASKVRKLLNKNNLGELNKLLPKTTIQLLEKYKYLQ